MCKEELEALKNSKQQDQLINQQLQFKLFEEKRSLVKQVESLGKTNIALQNKLSEQEQVLQACNDQLIEKDSQSIMLHKQTESMIKTIVFEHKEKENALLSHMLHLNQQIETLESAIQQQKNSHDQANNDHATKLVHTEQSEGEQIKKKIIGQKNQSLSQNSDKIYQIETELEYQKMKEFTTHLTLENSTLQTKLQQQSNLFDLKFSDLQKDIRKVLQQSEKEKQDLQESVKNYQLRLQQQEEEHVQQQKQQKSKRKKEKNKIETPSPGQLMKRTEKLQQEIDSLQQNLLLKDQIICEMSGKVKFSEATIKKVSQEYKKHITQLMETNQQLKTKISLQQEHEFVLSGHYAAWQANAISEHVLFLCRLGRMLHITQFNGIHEQVEKLIISLMNHNDDDGASTQLKIHDEDNTDRIQRLHMKKVNIENIEKVLEDIQKQAQNKLFSEMSKLVFKLDDDKPNLLKNRFIQTSNNNSEVTAQTQLENNSPSKYQSHSPSKIQNHFPKKIQNHSPSRGTSVEKKTINDDGCLYIYLIRAKNFFIEDADSYLQTVAVVDQIQQETSKFKYKSNQIEDWGELLEVKNIKRLNNTSQLDLQVNEVSTNMLSHSNVSKNRFQGTTSNINIGLCFAKESEWVPFEQAIKQFQSINQQGHSHNDIYKLNSLAPFLKFKIMYVSTQNAFVIRQNSNQEFKTLPSFVSGKLEIKAKGGSVQNQLYAPEEFQLRLKYADQCLIIYLNNQNYNKSISNKTPSYYFDIFDHLQALAINVEVIKLPTGGGKYNLDSFQINFTECLAIDKRNKLFHYNYEKQVKITFELIFIHLPEMLLPQNNYSSSNVYQSQLLKNSAAFQDKQQLDQFSLLHSQSQHNVHVNGLINLQKEGLVNDQKFHQENIFQSKNNLNHDVKSQNLINEFLIQMPTNLDQQQSQGKSYEQNIYPSISGKVGNESVLQSPKPKSIIKSMKLYEQNIYPSISGKADNESILQSPKLKSTSEQLKVNQNSKSMNLTGQIQNVNEKYQQSPKAQNLSHSEKLFHDSYNNMKTNSVIQTEQHFQNKDQKQQTFKIQQLDTSNINNKNQHYNEFTAQELEQLKQSSISQKYTTNSPQQSPQLSKSNIRSHSSSPHHYSPPQYNSDIFKQNQKIQHLDQAVDAIEQIAIENQENSKMHNKFEQDSNSNKNFKISPFDLKSQSNSQSNPQNQSTTTKIPIIQDNNSLIGKNQSQLNSSNVTTSSKIQFKTYIHFPLKGNLLVQIIGLEGYNDQQQDDQDISCQVSLGETNQFTEYSKTGKWNAKFNFSNIQVANKAGIPEVQISLWVNGQPAEGSKPERVSIKKCLVKQNKWVLIQKQLESWLLIMQLKFIFDSNDKNVLNIM